ncbi:RuBisCO large subunit C-terminal-like domain-containing protein, partial [uncultured Veillonella sp.]|uniref:RuBisCO large subunit C-terminal-like domain-containing protein n=1 Tax=uncultured Veillonella sp. TaxID=159268 RepID=UPI0026128A82
VIKDDHGISNQSFSQFKDRVQRCAAMVREMNEAHGTHTLYAANVSGDGTDVIERAYFAKDAGATALMVASGLVGFGWLHKLANDEKLGLPIIHHPAYSGGFMSPGVSGIADYLQLGLLPRIFGADMPIFVSYGGRFTFTEDQCKRISSYIKHPFGLMKAACPAPGGGVTDARLNELVELYGNDTMFLVGGDMFRRGPDIESNMAYFVERLSDLSESK